VEIASPLLKRLAMLTVYLALSRIGSLIFLPGLDLEAIGGALASGQPLMTASVPHCVLNEHSLDVEHAASWSPHPARATSYKQPKIGSVIFLPGLDLEAHGAILASAQHSTTPYCPLTSQGQIYSMPCNVILVMHMSCWV